MDKKLEDFYKAFPTYCDYFINKGREEAINDAIEEIQGQCLLEWEKVLVINILENMKELKFE